MKISIVTPVYNEPRLRDCLESINAQDGGFTLEQIVVDSNSTDDTVEIIDTYQNDIDCLIREDDKGVYDAMNKGIQQASGDIIGILNADDRYEHNKILHRVQSAMVETQADACYGNLVYVSENDEIVRYWKSGPFRRWKFYFGWMPPHPTFFVRKQVYETIGGFDLELPIAADYEFMLRVLLLNDFSVTYVNDLLVRMTLGGQSNESVTNMLQAVREMYQAWSKHRLKGRFTAPVLHPIEKLPQLVRRPS